MSEKYHISAGEVLCDEQYEENGEYWCGQFAEIATDEMCSDCMEEGITERVCEAVRGDATQQELETLDDWREDYRRRADGKAARLIYVEGDEALSIIKAVLAGAEIKEQKGHDYYRVFEIWCKPSDTEPSIPADKCEVQSSPPLCLDCNEYRNATMRKCGAIGELVAGHDRCCEESIPADKCGTCGGQKGAWSHALAAWCDCPTCHGTGEKGEE